MAMRRVFKFFLSLVVLFFLVGVVAVVGAWMVVSRGPSVPDHSTLILRIGGELVEAMPNNVLGQLTGGSRVQTVRGYVEVLQRAKSDPRIDSVLIIPTPFQTPYWGKVQEIRDAVLDFRKSGKRISAYLEYAGEREYYLATAAEKIYLVPTSSLDVTGIATYEVFLKGTLDKIGAQADFEKIGDYKTAPNQLTQTTFTPPHREMTESLTRDMYEQLVRGIAESRKKKVEDVRALIDDGPFLARDAHRAGLVDVLAYEDQLDDHGAVSKSGAVEGESYGRSRRSMLPRGAPRVAVIYVSGIINSGESGFDPLNGDVAGSVGLVKAIRSARADGNVRAIVVRIDSPGGSSIASDVIWRELTVTKNEKPSRPLVASMSDLAASRP
jgi:protease-4